MGCVSSDVHKEAPPPSLDPPPPKQIDPRLPFDNYRQLYNLKNSWKALSRSYEDTAKECLVLFFTEHPEHQRLHANLANLKTEEEMKNSTAFENAAVAIFGVFDAVLNHSEDVDSAIKAVRTAGQAHSSVPDFKAEYLKDMEGAFLGAARTTLGDRFTPPTEENFRRLFHFVIRHMTDCLQ